MLFRSGHIFQLQGKDYVEVDALVPGDIGAVAKIARRPEPEPVVGSCGAGATVVAPITATGTRASKRRVLTCWPRSLDRAAS